MKKKKREFRGIQVNYYTEKQFQDLTIDCHLGSLIVTKDDLLDYLEQRETDSWRDIKDPPQEDGAVLIFAPSEDPDKSLKAIAWYSPAHGWSNIPLPWIEAITQWMPLPGDPVTKEET